MKKTQFIKTFNIALMASKTFIYSTILFKIFEWFIHKISSDDNLIEQLPFSLIFDLSFKSAAVSLALSLASIVTIVFLITDQLIDRIGNGALRNLYLSVFKTIETRKYLHQRVRIGDKHTIDEVLFNKSLKHLFVDITNDEYTVFMKYPSTDQANKLLEQKVESLTKHIKIKNAHLFSFSKESYEKDGVWIIGSRKASE
ncbi:hypothetical protein [Vagococcus fluvialis]|uniref:hypothetical protein n=1 Tax=Vagococcus fluvialis TaxID=2738 RepID=UPI0037B240F0